MGDTDPRLEPGLRLPDDNKTPATAAQPMTAATTKILVTGFDRFGDYEDNPSGRLAELLHRRDDTIGVVLPTVFAESTRLMLDLIDRHQPVAVVMFGLANRRPGFHLEEVAHAHASSDSPDNAGHRAPVRSDDHPAALPTTLPLAEIDAALTAAELPVHRSQDAGGYVCNNLFYEVMHRLSCDPGADTPAGFIHVSALSSTVSGDDAVGAPLTIDALLRGATAMLDALVEGIR